MRCAYIAQHPKNWHKGTDYILNKRVTFNITVINKPAYIFRLEGIALVFVFVLMSSHTLAAENIILRESYAGNLSFALAGNTMHCSTPYCSTGWALVIMYENAQEPLRVLNIFNGFRNFWNNSITLTPNNFAVADNPAALSGKHAHITWEGDADIYSSENLPCNGSVSSGSGNSQGNQFNSYSNSTAISTSGVNIDIYNIGNYLSAGSQSVTPVYTSGQDRVCLTAEIIRVPNCDIADFNGPGLAEFIPGITQSGLSYSFTSLNAANDDLNFSDDIDSSDGVTYGYVPQPDAEGFDAKVTDIRFIPKGTLTPASGSSQPEFKFRYKVAIQ